MTRHVVGAALLAGAVIAPLSRCAVVRATDWTPLDSPLPLDGGITREFTVEKPGQYELAVRIDRPAAKPARDEAECRLGFDWVECAAGDPPVTLRWTLREHGGAPVRCDGDPAGGAVDRRSSGGRFTPTAVERRVGCFDAGEGSYLLDVRASNLGGLANLRPRLVVVPSSALDRERYSLTAGVWLTSVFVGLAGFLLVDRRE